MENKQNDYALFLAMLTSPAFIVQNGKVTQVNNQAKQMVIYPGDDIAPMLKDNPTLLETMDESTVSFTLTIEIFRCNAIITKLSDGFLFTIDDQVSSEVKALFLMVKQLRPSFARLQSLGLKHKELVPPDIRREMFRINRIFVNATNARRYSFKDAQFMQERDLCSVVDCTLEECAALLKEGGIELKYTIPKEAIHTLCDNLMIEQAVYNLICNAAQYADEGEAIEVELSRNDNIAQLTVARISPAPFVQICSAALLMS